ncbi:Exo_endo_phos domain-containing protein, partial [Cephalotus follicularis]
WNIRGLNNPLKQEEVGQFILSNKVAICSLFETKTLEVRVQQIVHRMCKNWEYTTNHAFTEQGRIWVVWDPSILKFEVTLTTDQAVYGKVVLGNGTIVHLSFIYGLCDHRSRRDLWKDLIFNSQRVATAPWLILGDFNVSRHPQDQLNGPPRVTKAMNEFNNCLNAMEVDNIKSVGRFFTRFNKREGNSAVNKKLDHVLGNWGWHRVF